jgi:hypothetical protein
VLENTSLVFSGQFVFFFGPASRFSVAHLSIPGKYKQQLKPQVVPYFISLSSKDFIRCRQPALSFALL